MEARRIEMIALDEIVPADKNPKRHSLSMLEQSMERWGYTAPLLLDERTGKLVAGHGRLDALKALRDKGEAPPEGVDENWRVPVVRGWASKTDSEGDAYLVADNQTTILGGWDDSELFQLLDSLDDLEGVGFSLDDLDELAKKHYGAQNDDDAPKASAGPHEMTCPSCGHQWLPGEK